MREIQASAITQSIKKLCIQANCQLPEDVKACISQCRGREAVHRLEIKDFPVTVIIDSFGNNLYELGPKAYLSARNED